MKVGRRLAIKLLNASKFALGPARRHGAAAVADPARRHRAARPGDARPTSPRSSTRPPRRSTATTTPGRSSAPRRSSGRFCDDYLELVKGRAYGERGAEAAASAAGRAAARAVDPAAPVRPVPAVRHRRGLVVVAGRARSPRAVARRRRARAPSPATAIPLVSTSPPTSLGEIRKAKTEAKRSLKTEVTSVVVSDTEARLAALRGALGDVDEAGRVADDHPRGRGRAVGRGHPRPRGAGPSGLIRILVEPPKRTLPAMACGGREVRWDRRRWDRRWRVRRRSTRATGSTATG